MVIGKRKSRIPRRRRRRCGAETFHGFWFFKRVGEACGVFQERREPCRARCLGAAPLVRPKLERRPATADGAPEGV